MIIRLKAGSISGKKGSELITHGPVYPNIESVEYTESGKIQKLFFDKEKATPATVLAYGGTSIEEKSKRMNYSGGYLDNHLLYETIDIVDNEITDAIWTVSSLSDFMEIVYGDPCESDEPGNLFNRILTMWALSRCAPYKRFAPTPVRDLRENLEYLKMSVIDPTYGGSVSLQVDSMKFTNFILPMMARLGSNTALITKINQIEVCDMDSLELALLECDKLIFSRRLNKNQRLFISELLEVPFTSMSPGSTTMEDVLEASYSIDKDTPIELVMEVCIKVWLTC